MINISPQNSKIGFIGTGIMGLSMAGHIQKAGYSLCVYTRTKEKAKVLLDNGAVWCNSVEELAKEVDVLFSIVGYPEDVRSIYLGSQGIITHIRPNTIVCDMTTSKPHLAIEIHDKAAEKNVISMDAPVSGGDTGAREARLAIMVGGPESGFEQLQPLYQLMGKNIVYMGPAGSGQHAKMCNQTVIAGTMMGMIEALRYAKSSGLDQETLLKAIGSGAAGSWSLDNLAPRILANDFGPGFLLKHFVKDMDIAAQESQDMKLTMPVLNTAIEYYKKAMQAEGGDLGTQGLYKLWQENPDW